MLALGAPGGKAASMLWEHQRDGRGAAPSMGNTDFVLSQFRGLQLHQSEKEKKAEKAQAAVSGSATKTRAKTSTREAAMRSRQGK